MSKVWHDSSNLCEVFIVQAWAICQHSAGMFTNIIKLGTSSIVFIPGLISTHLLKIKLRKLINKFWNKNFATFFNTNKSNIMYIITYIVYLYF